MAGSVLVEAGFLIALMSRRDRHHPWAASQAPRLPTPWRTCDAALSEAFHLLGSRGRPALAALLRRRAVVPAFDLADELDKVLSLMHKYADVPMSLADACLVRMSEYGLPHLSPPQPPGCSLHDAILTTTTGRPTPARASLRNTPARCRELCAFVVTVPEFEVARLFAPLTLQPFRLLDTCPLPLVTCHPVRDTS